jgi:hypothetical protein
VQSIAHHMGGNSLRHSQQLAIDHEQAMVTAPKLLLYNYTARMCRGASKTVPNLFRCYQMKADSTAMGSRFLMRSRARYLMGLTSRFPTAVGGTGSGSGKRGPNPHRFLPATPEPAAVPTAVKDTPFGWPRSGGHP